jgi:lysosome membrane protein 2
MHSSIRLEGKSRTLGVWRDPVVLSGLYGTVGISPNSNGITSKFIFWDGNLRRGFQFVDSGEKIDYPNLNGVRRYKLDSSELKNQESVPDNGIYYMTGPDGFLNMAPSFFGAPIWISQPHFLGADTSRYSYLSFSPNAQKHESYIDIEPLSGLVVRAAIRWQWNVLLKKQDFFTEPYYSNLFSSRDELMLPVFWIEENIEISTEAYTQLSDIMATQSSGKIALIVCLILGLIMFLVGLVMLYKLSKEQTSYRKPVEI